MVNFAILLLLYLINKSAGIADNDTDINSKLNLIIKSMQNGDSAFSKKMQSLTDRRLQSRIASILNVRHSVDFSGFITLCRTLLKRCNEKFCRNGKCYIFVTNISPGKCFLIQTICTR